MKSITSHLITLCIALFVPMLAHAAEIDVPPGYTLQILDGTKGEIARPDGWFYSYGTIQDSIVWTISKEDLNKEKYRTGFRIQFSPSIKRTTDKSPREVIANFIEKKRNSVKIDRLCEEKNNGEFQLICLETTEPSDIAGKNFKILYSLNWSNAKNSIVISTFGALEEDWNDLQDKIQVMSHYVLIGKDFWTTK